MRRARLRRCGRPVHHDPLSRLWGVVLPRPHRRGGGCHAGARTGPGTPWARLLSRPLRLLPAGTAADAPLRPRAPLSGGSRRETTMQRTEGVALVAGATLGLGGGMLGAFVACTLGQAVAYHVLEQFGDQYIDLGPPALLAARPAGPASEQDLDLPPAPSHGRG